MNGDEAGAFGAVFHAADLHPAFRVRQMPLTEIASLPVGMGILTLQYVVDLYNLVTGREPPFGITVERLS